MPEDTNAAVKPEALSDAYHKARRLLALFSAVLIAWEYMGISVGKSGSKEEVTATLPVAQTPVTLHNPEVFPVVILVLILYFALDPLLAVVLWGKY